MRVGVAVLAWNDPRRLIALLDFLGGLSARVPPVELRFYLFQDGWKGGDGGQVACKCDVEACVEAFAQADLPGKEAHVSEVHLGAGNRRRAAEHMSTAYEHFVVFWTV